MPRHTVASTSQAVRDQAVAKPLATKPLAPGPAATEPAIAEPAATDQQADGAVRDHVTEAGRAGRSGARRIGLNAASLLAGDVLNRGVTFAIYALVARYCDAHAFGQLSLGLTLLFSFQVLASIGLPTLVFRDVAKRPETDGKYLANGGAITCVAFFLCYALLGLFVLLSGYNAGTTRVIMLLGLSILPWSLSLITDAVFRAHERMHLMLWAAVPVNLAKLGMASYALSRGYGVATIAIVLFATHTTVLIVHAMILLRTIHTKPSGFDGAFTRKILQSSWKFFGIDAFLAVSTSVNVVLLSWFSGESAVGVYGAAVQLLLPLGITIQAIANSLFPIMCRRADQGREGSRQLAYMMLELLTLIALPGCVLLWSCAGPLISLIYQSDGFLASATLVRIMVPTVLFAALTRLLGQVLLSHGREDVNLRIVTVDLVFNAVCGVVLIYACGIYGAAITLLLTNLVDCGLHYWTTRSLLAEESAPAAKTRLVSYWHIIASSVAMAGVLVYAGEFHVVWRIMMASFTFLACFVALSSCSGGGALALRERFLVPLREKR